MKKTGCLLLVVVLLALCGCSEIDNVNTAANGITAEKSDVYVYKEGSGEKSPDKKIQQEEEEKISPTVYRTEQGERYHREGCYYLKSKIETTVDEAKAMFLTPCKRCNPPE